VFATLGKTFSRFVGGVIAGVRKRWCALAAVISSTITVEGSRTGGCLGIPARSGESLWGGADGTVELLVSYAELTRVLDWPRGYDKDWYKNLGKQRFIDEIIHILG
jgi:hypothetical protein